MAVYISITIMTIGLALFVNNRYLKEANNRERQRFCNSIFMVAIFMILFGVSACRIAVGNDYWEYSKIFSRIDAGQVVSTEIGFNAVVKVMQFLFGTGKISYLTIFAVMAFPTIYLMLKALYDQADHFPYTFFLFMMGGYYLSSLNTVRYYLVIAVALYAGKYAIRKEWARFIAWIVFASLFHKSVLVVIPLYWLATRAWKKKMFVVGAIMCLSFVVFQEFYRDIIFIFYPYYENSAFDTGTTSITNIARSFGVLIFSLIYYKKAIQHNVQNKFYFYLNLGALLLYVFCSFIPEISRIGYYMNFSNIILIPNILTCIESKKEKIFWAVSIGLVFILYFAIFLHRASDVSIRIVPYSTWIFS